MGLESLRHPVLIQNRQNTCEGWSTRGSSGNDIFVSIREGQIAIMSGSGQSHVWNSAAVFRGNSRTSLPGGLQIEGTQATARRGQPWVNERHPERNTDVVLFLDSFAEARRGGASTLDLTVRAAATLARHYVARRDRVGLVGFGGVLRWLLPGSGISQLYRIVDALLDTEIRLNYAWKGIDIVPPGTLPPQALVVAVTPLLDERSVNALLDLRSRGFDLAVIETSPLPYIDPGTSPVDLLAYRIWQLRRDALRTRYRRAGVAIAEWRPGEPLVLPIEEVNAFRRHALLGRS